MYVISTIRVNLNTCTVDGACVLEMDVCREKWTTERPSRSVQYEPGLEAIMVGCADTNLSGFLLELLDGSLVNAAAFVDQMPCGGRFAGIDMTNDHDVYVNLFLSHFEGFAVGGIGIAIKANTIPILNIVVSSMTGVRAIFILRFRGQCVITCAMCSTPASMLSERSAAMLSAADTRTMTVQPVESAFMRSPMSK